MSPADEGEHARSLQSVSDQELEGAVKADMRQSGLLGAFAFELRRAKAKKAKIGLVICGAGETTKRAFAAKQLLRIIRQIAWKGRNLGLAVEDLHACNFAGCRCPQDRGQFVAAALHLGFAGGADRSQRNDVDIGSGALGVRCGLGDRSPQHRLETIMARMVQMIGLGGGKQDAINSRPEQIAKESAAPDPETIQNSRQCRFKVVQRLRSRIECRQRIDQYDLAIEPREMIAEKWPDHQ